MARRAIILKNIVDGARHYDEMYISAARNLSDRGNDDFGRALFPFTDNQYNRHEIEATCVLKHYMIYYRETFIMTEKLIIA